MKMQIIKSEKRLCVCCMEVHDVKTVLVREKNIFKNIEVNYDAIYSYCDLADEFYSNEEQMDGNDIRLKDAYRKKTGLLTSNEIRKIREKYRISQSDLSILLGWGEKTITRYESHQVQDKAHDTILRKLDEDPEWFLSLLKAAKEMLSATAYRKYIEIATTIYSEDQDAYLRKSIEASYAKYRDDEDCNGKTELSLDKVIDVIRYFAASPKVTNLYKVKLMKLLWYADALSYKLRGVAMTGLVYQALPMGAVPIRHESIIALKGVPCEEVDMGETNAYRFELKGECEFPFLSDSDKEILDVVIEKFGRKSKSEIVTFMHMEDAYTLTAPRNVILFKYAEKLHI